MFFKQNKLQNYLKTWLNKLKFLDFSSVKDMNSYKILSDENNNADKFVKLLNRYIEKQKKEYQINSSFANRDLLNNKEWFYKVFKSNINRYIEDLKLTFKDSMKLKEFNIVFKYESEIANKLYKKYTYKDDIK